VSRLPSIILALPLAFCLPAVTLGASPKPQANQNSANGAPQQSHDKNSPPENAPPMGVPAARPDVSSGGDTSRPPHSTKAEALIAEPAPAANESSGSTIRTNVAILKICIRTQDDSPFSGIANIHVFSSLGAELAGKASETEEGETEYPDLPAGAYLVEASSPGFMAVKQTVEVEPGKRTQTVFLIMKPDIPAITPRSSGPNASSPTVTSNRTEASSSTSVILPTGWVPPGVDSYSPPTTGGISCSLNTVLASVGERAKQFVANLQKFSATENIEHYPIDFTGKRLAPQTRRFDYVAEMTTLPGGLFSLDEYRNGGLDRTRFPANVATEGLPAMALIFHPSLASDFKFDCEGLGAWHNRPAWIVHFVQRPDRISRLGGYRTQDHFYPWDFKGRAWIDAGSYQVLRLQMELAKPIPPVGLTEQLVIIDYAAVTFHSHKQQLWLPQSAEIYMERHGRRFYRVHTFTDFKIYTVATDQSIHAPKESYCFTNTSDHDIAGVLVVSPVSGISLKAVSIRFTIPPGGSIYKVVGPGKDISMPVDEVGSATFTHNGSADSIKADAYLVKESTLDVIADSPVSINP